MVTPPAEFSNGVPYWGEGHGGADWGVPEDDARNRIKQHLPRGITMEDHECFLRESIMQAHHVEQPTDDVEAEIRATIRNMALWLPDPRRMPPPLVPQAFRGRRVDASGSTLVHGDAGGVHLASRPGTNVYVAPGGEVYVAAAAGFVTHTTMTAGGGLIQPLLPFFDPSGTINGAPWSSGDGVPGHYWPLIVTGAFPTGDGEPPYLGGGALAVTDFFRGGDEETPYLGGRALAVTDFLPGGDGENPYLGGGALNPSVVRDGGGANARDQHVIDMPLAPPATGTADRARKYLEKLLFNFLPASVIALGPLSGASDNVKLATYIILAMLIVLLVVGISTGACAKHVVRLSTCAAIFAMTVFAAAQFSRGIYVAIAALVGVALSGITLAV